MLPAHYRSQEASCSGRGYIDPVFAFWPSSRASRLPCCKLSRRARSSRQILTTSRASSARATQVEEKPVIGIDLGTSNSAVAIIKDGGPVIIPLEAGRATMPSVIWLGKEQDEKLVGVAAQQAAFRDPLNSFYSVKRLIGRPYAQCRREAGMLVYKLAEGDSGETLLWSPAREQAFSTEEISGMMLQHLVRCAARHIGTDIGGAVIAVPAHFNDLQRQATLKAAELAGLERVQLLQEPVAAAMAYGLHHNQEEEAILVFDLGGGTYDVSLLEGFEGIFEVLATGGDSRLGGDDWDRAIADWCLQKCTAHLRMEIRGQPELLHQLLDSARLSKVQLSTAEQTVVHVPSSRLRTGPEVPMSRRQLEDATQRLRAKFVPPLERLGRDCHVAWAGETPDAFANFNSATPSEGRGGDRYTPQPRHITQVVLVGSATRIPSVRRFVTQLTGTEPCGWVNPEECVALGAAIQAGVLLGGVRGMELADGSFAGAQHGTTTGFQGLTMASP